MGARPIAILDSLRFRAADQPAQPDIMEGVISGIAAYGNSIGVPTVGGEVYFDECYSLNPLVNVFCLGLAEKDKIFYAKTEAVGNAVLVCGRPRRGETASTGPPWPARNSGRHRSQAGQRPGRRSV